MVRPAVGVFHEVAWDWFSLRLDDGREIMLYSFPTTGYRSGTLIASDGQSSTVNFDYDTMETARLRSGTDRIYRLGWRIRLETGEEFYVTPLIVDQLNAAIVAPQYWEGLCRVMTPDGNCIGYCVVETTEEAQETLRHDSAEPSGANADKSAA